MAQSTLHIYINMPEQTPNFSTITDAIEFVTGYDESNGYTEEEQVFPAIPSDITPVIFHIGEGVYREKLIFSRPNITLLGAGRDKTTIVYGDGAFEILEDGEKRGTFRTATVRINTHDFTAKHLTFQNDAGFGHTVGQALALYVDGDRNYFEDCNMIGSQDTLFTAPLPMKESQPHGFRGPGEYKPRIMGRQCYRNCFIQGDVDFIFGGAIAYFEDCTIHSKKPGDRRPPESGEEDIYGYITAASTFQDQEFGYVLKNCRLTSDCPTGSIYLGRPWREWAKTVYINCELGEHIHPLGWNDWEKTHGHFYYGEYNSYGPGANADSRADFSHQLTNEEAAKYTKENVLQGWDI